jgi:hypothetical protein
MRGFCFVPTLITTTSAFGIFYFALWLLLRLQYLCTAECGYGCGSSSFALQNVVMIVAAVHCASRNVFIVVAAVIFH